MSTVVDRQEYSFQAEIKQVLHLLSHSLYQSREIALRELISNASDALDKMRYIALTDETQRDTGPLEITLEGNETDKQLIIRDTGVGMTHDELVTNLGTIAHSGSGEFLKALASARSEKEKAELSLIGQFGVGFYAAFMIADRVRVRTRSYTEESGWEWESEGTGTFTITPVDGTAAARHRGDPSPQRRCQGFHVTLAASRKSSSATRALCPIRSGWVPTARSSTIKSRSGSSPRTRSPTSSISGSTST